MIVNSNEYESVYFDEKGGFLCKIYGLEEEDHGQGWGRTKEDAFDIALIDYLAHRTTREKLQREAKKRSGKPHVFQP